MKIAVYTIALNEEKHVERWYESAKDADYLLIADTGSTDKTIKIAKKLGINVIKISVKPWRFDDARNAALAMLPDDIDYCVSMDMDETLSEGWRKCLEKMTGDNITYKFNVNFRDEAETHPYDIFVNNRIHKRHGFRWHFLMHEALVSNRTKDYTTEFCEGLEVSHHPDQDKPRDQYNQMIEDAYLEYKDERYHKYHALQLMSFGRIEESIKVFKDLLKFKTIDDYERALVYVKLSLLDSKNAVKHLKKSLKIKVTKDALLELSVYYLKKEQWHKCYKYAKAGMAIDKYQTGMLVNIISHGYLLNNIFYTAKHNKKYLKWTKSYKKNKRELNIYSTISHNFEVFKD